MLVPFRGSWWHYVLWDTKPAVISSVAWEMWSFKMGQYLLLCCLREHENDCFPIYTWTWIVLMVLLWNDPEEWKFSTCVWKESTLFTKLYAAIWGKRVGDNKAPCLRCVCVCVHYFPNSETCNQFSLTHVIQNFLFLDLPEANCW